MSESTTTPTPEPMTPSRRAEIRERAESVKTWKGYYAEPVPQLVDVDVPALLAEVERLRAELAKRPKSRLGEQVNRLSNAVGDLERERDEARAEAEQARATADGLGRDYREARAEVEQWRTTFGETALRDGLARMARVEAERDEARAEVERLRAELARWEGHDAVTATLVKRAEAERDRLAEQVKRVRSYAKEGCLGSKSTIYNRVGEDLLTIVGDGTGDGQ